MSHKGGWQKKKVALQKKEREANITKCIPKLSKLFSDKSDASSINSSSKDNQQSASSNSSSSNDNQQSASSNSNGNQQSAIDGIFSNDPGNWNTNEKSRLIAYWAPKGPCECQNIPVDFSITKRQYPDKVRFLNRSYFEFAMPNKQLCKREWLLYSPSMCSLYCFYCTLFSDKGFLFTKGFTDWKNKEYVANHPSTPEHLKSLKCYSEYTNLAGRVDISLEKQIAELCDYWNKVLFRIIETVVFLAERKEPFRGSDEQIG